MAVHGASYFGTPVSPRDRIARRLGWTLESWEGAGWPALLVVGVAGILVMAALAGAPRSTVSASPIEVEEVAAPEPDPAPTTTTPPTTTTAPPVNAARAAPVTTAPGPPRPPCRAGDPLAGVPDPDRYHVLQACLVVRGTVTLVQVAEGGGFVAWLVPDGELAASYVEAYGREMFLLVLPAVCRPGTPSRGPCGAHAAGVPLVSAPRAGDRVEAKGPLVVDEVDGYSGLGPLEEWQPLPPDPA